MSNTRFTPHTAAARARKSHTNGNRIPRKNTITQAIDLQVSLHAVGIGLARDIAQVEDVQERARVGSALASIAKGWDALSARIQTLKGRPLPGTLSPAERRAKAQSKAAPERDDPRPIKPNPGA